MATKSKQESTVDRSKAKIENFKRLASKRVTKVLRGLDGVAALANRNSYTYDAAQVQKITHALRASLENVEKSFTSSAANKAEGFTV